MQTLARVALILVMILMTLSAYLRLDHSGIGCEPWPACYANIGIAAETPDAAATYERLLAEAQKPLSWATPLHRLVASILGLVVLGMTLVGLRQKRNRLMTFSLLSLTVFLAWLGIYSAGLHSPAVVLGNLCGGFAMLGLLGWLVLKKPHHHGARKGPIRIASMAAILALSLQILFGGLTSANFAASACPTLPHCNGTWLPGTDLASAFDISRIHETSATGIVLGGAERADIQKLHRLMAVLSAIIITFAGILAIRAGADLKYVGLGAILLVTVEILTGASAILAGIPILLAVAHNLLAALLLLALIKLFAESQAGFGWLN
ncbi:MAG: cytochrome c oxidase assembly protein subunit 15 [Woeseiaceae bacterium]|jgi:cytochrome c oxidase assembly protein subunit 15